MSFYSNNFIRVRLHFDYPPPSAVDCRMCWLLVDLNKCRVVADLEGIIREKFEFSRRSILNLFIEDCYLPHTESIYVVRDNDSLRVKVDCLARINVKSSCPDTASENCKKRQRLTKEDIPGENGVSMERKKKKRKRDHKESYCRDTKQSSGDESNKESQGKCTEKKKRKKAGNNGPIVAIKAAASTKIIPVKLDQPVKSNKKPPVVQENTINVSSSDSSSSRNKEDEVPIKVASQKPATKISPYTSAASEAFPTTIPTQTKPKATLSSSLETVSMSDEDTHKKNLPKNKTLTSTRKSDKLKPPHSPSALQSTVLAQKQVASIAVPPHDNITKPCTSNSTEEIKLVVRQPVKQWGHGVGSRSTWRGCGRVKDKYDGLGERGRGQGRWGSRGHNGSLEFSYNGVKKLSYQTDSLINMPMVLQNEAESAPKQDYSSMPLLAAPPLVGQKIAFKLLELTENYTPEISEYKEGRIVSFDHTTNQIELELHNASQAPVVPGKFDLIYLNPDGSERVEYAVSRGSRVTELWDSLREPRLII